MPTYGYKCDQCEHEFELFQSITAAPLRTCPECGKRKVRRLIGTGAGILFKGSGFYETDYRSDSYKKAAAKETKGGDKKSDDKTTPAGSEGGATKSESTTKKSSGDGSATKKTA